MGGDFGPAVVVEGAVTAAREFGLASVLVGDTRRRRARDRSPQGAGPADQRAPCQPGRGHGRAASHALRRKRDSSLRVAAELCKEGECQALVSAGNTGAAMAIGMYVMGLLPGVDRPAIAAALPSLSGYTILIDAGANVDPKPRHLFQFAIMGHVYSRDIVGKDNPRVGLLSVGEEEGKGNELTKGDVRGAPPLVDQLHRQHRGARHLQRPLRRGGDGRVHGQRLPQGLGEPGRDAHGDDPAGGRARRPLAGGRRAVEARLRAHEAAAWTTRRWAAPRSSASAEPPSSVTGRRR